jgi:SAM-dependent methyltransferase
MNKSHVNEAVDRNRWEKAQTWERAHWVRDQKELAKFGKNQIWRALSLFGFVEKYRGDDRNSWWSKMFNDYKFLPSSVENALEVGCGPYTNIRLIRKVCEPKHLFLSDPLIRTYADFKMTFVNEMYKKRECMLDDHPLEELPFADGYFDLTVMINVLDHVRDAGACMRNLIRVTKRGGFVVVGQDLTNAADFAKQPDGLQIGHPITLDQEWFDGYFKGAFEEKISQILPREAGWAPDWHYGTLIYAGVKK